MTALMVILCIILFFVLLFSLRIHVVFSFENGQSKILLKVLCFHFPLFPTKKKWKMKNHLPKYYEKQKRKSLKKQQKKKMKKMKKAEVAKGKPKVKQKIVLSSIPPLIRFYTKLLTHFLKKFGSHLQVDIWKMHMIVASGDASKTALLYGESLSIMGSFLAFLDEMFHLKIHSPSAILVEADYSKTKIDATILFSVSFKIRQLFAILFSTLIQFLKMLGNKERYGSPTLQKKSITIQDDKVKKGTTHHV